MDDSSGSQSSASALRNPKHRHIARSAAKRESVQLLGSIKDLQAHFARAGFVEHRPGAGAGLKGSSLNTLGEGDEVDGENRPPPAQDERRRERKTWKEVDLPRVDPIAARREARGIVGSMRATWELQSTSSSSGSKSMVSSPTTLFYPDHSGKDTRGALVNTARSIRTIRTLALAISHVARPTDRRVSSSSQLLPRPSSKFRQSFSTPSRPTGMPRAVSLGVPERKSSLGALPEAPQNDIQADLRRAAIEVLACLRALEEIMRVHDHGGHDGDGASRAGLTDSPIESTGTGSTTLGTDTAQTSLRPPSSEPEYDDYGDDEEEYSLNALALADAENEQHTQTWEERIVAEGRQYSGIDTLDPSVSRLGHVKDSLARWIAVVERIFQAPSEGANDLEDWAKSQLWYEKPRDRIQNFLSSYLPLQLQILMPSTADRVFSSTILTKLSDGFVLIHAFNAVVLSSSKPWGFVPEEDIHDTISRGAGLTPDGEGGKEWTFRRIGNLTSWAAALRHRYNLPISLPTTTTSSAFLPKATTLPSRAPGPSPDFNQNKAFAALDTSTNTRPPRESQRIDFDPALIAKKGAGWEVMFESLLTRWVEEASIEACNQLRGSVDGI